MSSPSHKINVAVFYNKTKLVMLEDSFAEDNYDLTLPSKISEMLDMLSRSCKYALKDTPDVLAQYEGILNLFIIIDKIPMIKTKTAFPITFEEIPAQLHNFEMAIGGSLDKLTNLKHDLRSLGGKS